MTTFKSFLDEIKRDDGDEDKQMVGDPPVMGKKAARMGDDNPSLLLREKETLFDEVKSFLSIGKVKHMFTLGTELFGAASPFLEKPTWWNAGKAALAMGKALVEDVEVFSEEYFSGDEWTQPYSSDFNQSLLNVLQKLPFERIKTSEENVYVRICTLPTGARAGWTYSTKAQTVDRIYVETEHLDASKEYVRVQLWEQFKGKSLVMRKNNRITFKKNEISNDSRVIFEIDDAFESKVSKRATQLSTQLKKPLSKGITRSIMFYGPPGTGKSTLARTVVELMQLRSFRIRIADLGGLDNSTLFEAINIFQPDAVILDDFDRASGQASLLETLEFFGKKIKLVITTVNNRRKLDAALLRPERIDILERVDRMDDVVIKHVLGEYVDGYDLVKDWPIAFIQEYVTRRGYLEPDEAVESMKELTMRVAELDSYRDDAVSDFARMMKTLKKAKKKAGIVDEPPDSDSDAVAQSEGDDDSPFDQST